MFSFQSLTAAVLLLLTASTSAFAPRPVLHHHRQAEASSTSLKIGGLLQGLFGKTVSLWTIWRNVASVVAMFATYLFSHLVFLSWFLLL